MAVDEDFQSLFIDTDLVLVVDEWKGTRTGSEPELLVARSFDSSSLPLYRTLAAKAANKWHASGKRAEHDFLFSPGNYASTIKKIEETGTCLYDHLFRDLADYAEGTAAAANWQRIMADNEGLGTIWKVDSSRHARALFWFIEGVLRCLAPRSTPGTRIRVVIDRQDWFVGRRGRVVGDGLVHLCGRRDAIIADVFTVANKSHGTVSPYLPLFGLVDSEAWALGRWLSTKSKKGIRVHDLAMRWMRDGQSDAIREELDELFNQIRTSTPELAEYLELQMSWGSDKFVELNEGLAAIDADPPSAV